MSEAVDVAVVGAGPAGSAAALHLARAGRRVVLFDKALHPRYKTCGGALVGRAAAELPIPAPGLALRAAEMHSPRAQVSVRVERDQPMLWMTMRSELDAALLATAVDAGAEARQPCAVTGVVAGEETVRLETEGGAVQARLVVAADGALSPTAAALGWPVPPLRAPALEWEIEVSSELQSRFCDAGRFDFDCVPDGYGWVFPKPGHLSVGLLSMRPGRKDLRARLERYLEDLGLGEHEDLGRHGFVIPLAPRPGPPARGRVLLVGDALGLCDPLTAEGISPALISGRLAAQAIEGADLEPREACATYARELRRELLANFALARRVARFIYGRPAVRRRLLGRLGPQVCEAMVSQIAGEQTYRELLLDPRNYARLLFSRAPAATSA